MSHWSNVLAAVVLVSGIGKVRSADCNNNALEDSYDIRVGTSRDCDQNSVPDECDIQATPFALEPSSRVPEATHDIVAGDFDGDGLVDLAATNWHNDLLTIYFAVGDGSFLETEQFDVAGNPGNIVTADLDGDRVLDLLVVSDGRTGASQDLFVFLNHGNGRFLPLPPMPLNTPSSFSYKDRIATGDFDGDGVADVVIASLERIIPLYGFGDGTFDPGSAASIPEINHLAFSIESLDWNNDGRLDMVVSGRLTSDGSHPTLLLNAGNRRFVKADEIRIHLDMHVTLATMHEQLLRSEELTSITTGDLDGDADIDIVSTGSLGHIVIHWNDGPGTFSESTIIIAAGAIYSATIVDLDGDGDLDLVAGTASTSNIPGSEDRLRTYLNGGNRLFINGPTAEVSPGDLVAGDFDLDGDVDLITSSVDGAYVILSFSDDTSDKNANRIPDSCERPFVRGDCDGDGSATGNTADAVFLLNFSFLGGPPPRCLSACDANGDGIVGGSVMDAVYMLTFSFLQGPRPPQPYPECGSGTLSDVDLGCDTPVDCQ